MNAPSIIGAVMLWTWRKTLRRPVLLTFSLVQPWIWLLLFGFLFQRYAVTGQRYLDYLVCGVACMTVLMGASQAGVPWIRDLQTGFLQRIWRTPASRGLVLAAKVIADALRLAAQALLLCAFGKVLGAHFDVQLALLPYALFAVLVLGASLSLFSCAIALSSRNPETMGAYVHLVTFPILFTSSALVPRRDLPAWLEALAAFNPMSVAVEALRAGLQQGPIDIGVNATIALGWLAIAILIAGLALGTHLRNLMR